MNSIEGRSSKKVGGLTEPNVLPKYKVWKLRKGQSIYLGHQILLRRNFRHVVGKEGDKS